MTRAEMIEAMARAEATWHYADRFNKPADDPHVLMNVDCNWTIFSDECSRALSAIERAGMVVVDRTDLLEQLRTWCKSRFGMWITWRTAQSFVTAMIESGRLKP